MARVLVVGLGNMGRSHALAHLQYALFVVGIIDHT